MSSTTLTNSNWLPSCSQCRSMQGERRPAQCRPDPSSPRYHRPSSRRPTGPTKPHTVRVHGQLLYTRSPLAVAWGAPMGGADTLSPYKPGPRVVGAGRHLNFPVHPCYSQSGGSATLFVAEILDVRWTAGPL